MPPPAFDPKNPRKLDAKEFIALTGWDNPSETARNNMGRALEFFQSRVSMTELWAIEAPSPFLLKIQGNSYKIISWMQAIEFDNYVDNTCIIAKGMPLQSFRDPGEAPGTVRGRWYARTETDANQVAIYPHQVALHKFKAISDFTCLESTVSDAYCGWLADLPSCYRHGSAKQLFIPNAPLVLEPIK